jgi:hypothetical protein
VVLGLGLGSYTNQRYSPGGSRHPGRNLSSYGNHYPCLGIGSQRYLGRLPVLSLPRSFPTYKRELWTRRDSNPHLVAGQANVLPLHHGPRKQSRDESPVEEGWLSHREHRGSRIGNCWKKWREHTISEQPKPRPSRPRAESNGLSIDGAAADGLTRSSPAAAAAHTARFRRWRSTALPAAYRCGPAL